MDEIYLKYGMMADALAAVSEDFAPIVQKVMVEILADSGLESLLEGDKPKEKLENFVKVFGAENILTETVEKVLKLDEQLAYVLRYCMRPALNFANKYNQKHTPATQGKNSAERCRVEGLRENHLHLERLEGPL